MRFVINPFTELLDVASLTGSGAPPIETITGNSGGAVGPDPTTFNLNLLGDNASGINVVGNPGTYTLTIFGLASSITQIGVTSYATNAEAATQISSVTALTPSNITSFFSTHPLPASQGGTGLASPAAHQLMVTEGSSAFNLLGVASNGQIPIGSIGSDPVLANITSTGSTISITNGPGTINLEAAGGKVVQTLTGNSGGAISPTAGNINTLGTGSITIVGSGSTLTTELTGLTNHAIQIGAGTATLTQLGAGTTGQVLQTNTTADPTWSTATYPSTTTANQILYSSATNTVSGLATANKAVLTTGATGTPVLTALATDGQLIIGSTAGVPAASTLTAGTGITITNAGNNITIATSASGTLNTLTGNSGGAISPTAGNINTLGTGSITIAGSGSTLTTQLTGLTNHNVQVGAGTATLTQVAPSATSGIPFVSNGSSSDPSFTTALVAGGGTGATSFNTNGVVISNTSGTGALAALSLSSGQLVIGGTSTPAAATLTAGTGVSITNGNNSITIATTGGGITWVDSTGSSQAITAGYGYLSDNATSVAFSLPASATQGDYFRIAGVQGAWTLSQASGQQVKIGSAATTAGAGGSLASTNAGDSIECVATNTSASTIWRVISFIGNITVT